MTSQQKHAACLARFCLEAQDGKTDILKFFLHVNTVTIN